MIPKTYHRPKWPELVGILDQADRERLERDYDDFKVSRRFPRVSRISAEDFATIWVDRLVATGRAHLHSQRG